MSQGPETRIVHAIMQALNARPMNWSMKVHGGIFQSAGIPDIIGCDSGRFFGIEVKTPVGKATKLQLLTIRRIIAAGGRAGVATSVEEALTILEQENT